jgi:hypothetical protein
MAAKTRGAALALSYARRKSNGGVGGDHYREKNAAPQRQKALASKRRRGVKRGARHRNALVNVVTMALALRGKRIGSLWRWRRLQKLVYREKASCFGGRWAENGGSIERRRSALAYPESASPLDSRLSYNAAKA